MALSKQTAMDIALAHREAELAAELLGSITEAASRRETPDVRDAFGRLVSGLELGVPSDHNSRRLYSVSWKLARVVLEAHIAEQRAVLEALSEKARIELASASQATGEAS